MRAFDPASGGVVPLYNPRRDNWAEHFVWSEDRALMIGVSATGRATIERLEPSRPNLVNLRRVLAEAGLHPPFWR